MLKIRKGNAAYDRHQKETDLKVSLIEEQTPEEVAIELLIRERYSMSQELALHRKAIMGNSEEWDVYCEYVQECVARVRNGNMG